MKDPQFGSNKIQSFIEFETTQGKLRFGKEGLKVFIEFGDTKTYITDDTGNVDVGTSELGANPTPVARTNNPIVGANKPNENIDVLDAAIGTDAQVTPAARTVGPVVVDTTVHQKIEALDNAIGIDVSPYARTVGFIATNLAVNQNLTNLDTAIGADAHFTPLTRTTGQLALGTTLYQMLELIDSVIGSDAQMPTSSLIVSRAYTIYQNLRALDTYKSLRTVKYRVGNVGVASSDFNFASAANANEQSIDLGSILPAKCRIMDVMVYTDAAFTNLGALTTDVGLTTGTDGLIVAANNTALDAIMATANAGAFIATPNAAAQNVWLNVKPTNNWDSANPVGRMSVYVSFIDLTNV